MLLGLVPKSFFSIPKALGWGRLRDEPKERNRRGEGPGDEVAAKIHFQPIFPTLVVHRQNFWARRNRKQNIHNRGLSVNEPKLNGVRLGKHGQKVPQTLETGKRRAGENSKYDHEESTSIDHETIIHTRDRTGGHLDGQIRTANGGGLIYLYSAN